MTIYYLCPEHKTPVGGVRVIYQHVDILNRKGVPAYVVHKTKGFRVNWFENTTPIVYWRDNLLDRFIAKFKRRMDPDQAIELPIQGGTRPVIDATDILVIPELYGSNLPAPFGRSIKKVILNQNSSLTFNGYSLNKARLMTTVGSCKYP